MATRKPWAVVQHYPIDVVLGPLVATAPRTGREIEISGASNMTTIAGIYRFSSKSAAQSFADSRRKAAGDDAACSDPIKQSA